MRKNILLIGGSYGIGHEIVKQLHASCSVFVLSRTNEGLGNMDVTHLHYDVMNDIRDISGLPEHLDGLVYCPGSITLKPFKMLDESTFRDDMEVNFFGLLRVVRALQNRLAEGSNVLFFSTVAASTGMPYHTSVAAAKGAVEGFARALAAELAPKVRVNVIAPSLIDTPLSSRLLNSDKKKEKMAERHPLKRVGRPGDIAGLAVFLLTSEDHWITGQVLGVDGGISSLNMV